MIKKIIKRFFQVLGLLLVLVVVYLLVNFKHTAAFPGILSAFHSKEFCSCYFVTEGKEDECENFARQWLPIQGFSIDKKDRSVTTKALFVTTTARYTGDRYGCVLDPWK